MNHELGLRRLPGKTWLETALERASRFGLQREVRDKYDALLAEGKCESEAAFWACYEWDILDLTPVEG